MGQADPRLRVTEPEVRVMLRGELNSFLFSATEIEEDLFMHPTSPAARGQIIGKALRKTLDQLNLPYAGLFLELAQRGTPLRLARFDMTLGKDRKSVV